MLSRKSFPAVTNRLVSLFLLAGLAILPAFGCGQLSRARLARRILEDHRARTRTKPLPAAHVIRLGLTPGTSSAASGAETIEWDQGNYRETVSSAGLTTIAGIQGEKGYFADEDGVTRVASEPLLSELVSRFYFWRRSYLFDEQPRTRLDLGPADESSVSVLVTPFNGAPILLTFSRKDLTLLRARAPHLDVTFSTPTSFRDASRPGRPIDAVIRWAGLPTGPLSDAAAGGWSARWATPVSEVAFSRIGRSVALPVGVSGFPATLALDAQSDGPLRVRPGLADRLGLSFSTDVFGRVVARGARLEIGGLTYPSLSIERTDAIPEGVDACAGAALLREAIVEIDPAARRIRFLDPAPWVIPQGFVRVLLDDDGDRPAVILRRKGQIVRLLGPTALSGDLALTPETCARLGLPSSARMVGGLWMGADLPPLSFLERAGDETLFGEDGLIGWDLVLRFHSFFDLPHRWAYLKPSA